MLFRSEAKKKAEEEAKKKAEEEAKKKAEEQRRLESRATFAIRRIIQKVRVATQMRHHVWKYTNAQRDLLSDEALGTWRIPCSGSAKPSSNQKTPLRWRRLSTIWRRQPTNGSSPTPMHRFGKTSRSSSWRLQSFWPFDPSFSNPWPFHRGRHNPRFTALWRRTFEVISIKQSHQAHQGAYVFRRGRANGDRDDLVPKGPRYPLIKIASASIRVIREKTDWQIPPRPPLAKGGTEV